MTAKALTLPGADSKFLDRPGVESSVWGYNSYTWRFVFTPASVASQQCVAGAGLNDNRGAGKDGWLLYIAAGGAVLWRLCSDPTNSNFGQNYPTGISLSAAELCDLIITLNPGGSNVGFYRSGFNTQNASPGGMVAPSTPLTVGNFANPAAQGSGQAFNGTIYEVGAWSGILANDTIRGLQCSGVHSLLTDPSPGPYYPDSGWKWSTNRTRLYTLNATPNDETGGAGTHGADLTEHGGPLDYSANTILFGGPAVAGASALTLSSAAYAPGRVTLTFDRAVLDSAVLRNPTRYAITAPGGEPSLTVTSATPSGSTVVLSTSGVIYNGGSYSVAIATADTVRASADEGGNAAAASASFSVPATQLVVSSVAVESATSLLVTYSRPVKQVSSGNSNDALNPSNYSIAPPGPSVASVVSVSTTQVRLTTSSESPGSYTLTVVNVQDTSGGPI